MFIWEVASFVYKASIVVGCLAVLRLVISTCVTIKYRRKKK